MVFGVVVSIFWSRAASVMLYSILGVSMLMIMGMLGLAISRPQLLGILPSQTGSQIATFGGMVLFGALVQWRTSRQAVPENQQQKIQEQNDSPIPRIAA